MNGSPWRWERSIWTCR